MNWDRKFFIYGLARSGTTQIFDICRMHDEINGVCHEPTMFCYKTKMFLLQDDIKQALEYNYNKFDVIKEVDTIHNCKFVEYIFSLPIKLIITDRNNVLQQTISKILSGRLNIWHKNFSDSTYFDLIRKSGPILLDEIEFEIALYKKRRNLILNQLKGKDYFLIDYENFFFGDYKGILKNMFNYMGIKPILNTFMLNELNNNKLNSINSYLSICNIKEIEEKFGNINNGYLLK